jgi:hypothetical protein
MRLKQLDCRVNAHLQVAETLRCGFGSAQHAYRLHGSTVKGLGGFQKCIFFLIYDLSPFFVLYANNGLKGAFQILKTGIST